MSKKAILAVSFGTTFPETREKTIGAIEKAVGKNFPDYDVFRAFTSKIVRKRIAAKENIKIDDPATALQKLADKGYEEVYVQSLHIMPGIEYGIVQQVVANSKDKFKKIVCTQPLLDTFADFTQLVNFLKKQSTDLPNGQAMLWMGHGTSKSVFTTYACLDHMLAFTKSYVGTVESYPRVNDEIKLLKRDQIKKVVLQPLMIVAGNHAHNDMASDDPHSWKSILKSQGIEAQPVLKGLGQYPEIQQMFIAKLQTTMKGK